MMSALILKLAWIFFNSGSNQCGFVSVEYNRQDESDEQDYLQEDPNVILSCQDSDMFESDLATENQNHQHTPEEDYQDQVPCKVATSTYV